MEGPNTLFEIERGKSKLLVLALPFYEVEPEEVGDPEKRAALRMKVERLKPGAEVTIVLADLQKSKGEGRGNAVLNSVSAPSYRLKVSAIEKDRAEFQHLDFGKVVLDFEDHQWVKDLLEQKRVQVGDKMVAEIAGLNQLTPASFTGTFIGLRAD
jgi:hypothetical protein